MSRQPQDLLYRDKIEVSLDGRQIFYLFFGGAVIVGLVFVLGVMVGRRVEARGHVDRARTTAAQDPLAALDRLESNGGMSFRGSLMGATSEHASDVERQIREIEKARKPDSAAPPVVAPPAPKVEEKPEPAKPEVEQKPVTKPEQAKAEPKKPEADEKKLEAKVDEKRSDEKKLEAKVDEKRSDAKKLDEKKVEAKKLEAKAEEKKPEAKKLEAKAEEKKPEEKKESDEKKSKYVLQLSSFQDRAEAEAFLAQIKGAGYSPFLTEGTVNGTKFYRVRMGSYKSLESANDAKSEIEKSLKKSATVMKI